MLRLLYISTFLLLLTSCGSLNSYQKIRLVKSQGKEHVVLEKTDKIDKTSEQLETIEFTPVLASIEVSEQIVPETNIQPEVAQKQFEKEEIEPEEPEEDINEKEVLYEALKTESRAKKSFIWAVIGLSSAIIPYLGIIPMIVGLVYFAMAKNSRYVTPVGYKKMKNAGIVLLIDAGIILLYVALVLALILFL